MQGWGRWLGLGLRPVGGGRRGEVVCGEGGGVVMALHEEAPFVIAVVMGVCSVMQGCCCVLVRGEGC